MRLISFNERNFASADATRGFPIAPGPFGLNV